MQNRLGTVLSVAGFNWAGTTTDNNSVNSLMVIGGYLNTSAQTVATATNASGMQFFNGGFYWYGNSGLTPGNVYTNTQRMFLTVGGNLIIGSGADGGFRLDVSGTARLTGALTGTSATFSSTATATAFIPTGSTVPTNGMYLSAANTLAFSTNSTIDMTLSSAGNVLIGTTTDAGFRLDVSGTGRFSGAVTFSSTTSHTGTATFGSGSPTAFDGADGTLIIPKIRLYNTTPATIYSDFVSAATTNRSITVPDASGTMALTSNLSAYLPLSGGTLTGALGGTTADFSGNARFTSAGNWMQFETNVLTSLNNDGAHIRSVISTDANPTYTWKGDTNTGMFSPSADTIGFSTGGTTRLTIASTGAATFSSTLTMSAYSYASSAIQFTRATTNTIAPASGNGILIFGGGNAQMRIGTANDVNFYMNNGGSPYTALKLQQNGNTVIINSPDNSLPLGIAFGGTVHGYMGAASSALYAYSTNGGYVLLNASSTWIPASDVKRKRNFETYNLGLNAILGLETKLYHMDFQKDSEEKQVGLIAQQVREHIPQAFEQNEDFIGINYNAIIVTLINAIQEQQAQINELKTKIK